MSSKEQEQYARIPHQEGPLHRAGTLTIRGWIAIILTSTLLILTWLRPSTEHLRIGLDSAIPNWLTSSYEDEAKRILANYPLIGTHMTLAF